jgi:DNA-binding XRE family transcriptional regulator/predicted RNase H-like HicB family nuclease
MTIGYYAKINYIEKDKAFEVDFPGMGIYTYGESLEDAKKQAQDALTGYLAVIVDKDMDLPVQKLRSKSSLYLIKPDPKISFAIWIKKARQEKGYTQKQIADLLNISYQAYQKYEKTKTANPTLKRITELEKIFEDTIITL